MNGIHKENSDFVQIIEIGQSVMNKSLKVLKVIYSDLS